MVHNPFARPGDASAGSANNKPFLPNLLTSGDYSDFILKSHGHDFNLHKAVVCSQSRVFAAALSGNFKVITLKPPGLPRRDRR
jgi:hypothetical protein